MIREIRIAVVLGAVACMSCGLRAQVNVVTAHNDIARTGQNTQETVLTPANVNSTQFGKLFSQPVNGSIYAQPLYVAQVAIPGKGTHNVVYVAPAAGDIIGVYGGVTGEYVYAFDADTNGGANASPLWQVSLLTNGAPAGTYTSNFGVVGTPVIDLPSKTMYLVSSENQGSTPIYRLHALDITTGAEKFGGPVQIQASMAGTGTGSTNGTLAFNPIYEFQRAGLLYLNGVVYVAFGSVGDQGPWHGWLFSFDATTLRQINFFGTSANGSGDGFWMAGAGLAAEVYDPSKPYGRLFVSTGNGSYQINAPTVAGQPYSNPLNQYGMSVLDFDLAGGVMTLEDTFTPFNEAKLNGQDGDLGSGAPILLPNQTLASGKTLNPLLEIGKSGTIYLLDRDNSNDGSNNPATEYSPAGLGGFNAAKGATSDLVVQAVQPTAFAGNGWGNGIWGSPAYWNNHIFYGGNFPVGDTVPPTGDRVSSYSFVNGVISSTPTSQSSEQFAYPGPTPSVSANGLTNGIVWVLTTAGLNTLKPETLLAYDATNLANTLFSSSTNLSRDNPGLPVEFVVPTVVNGKVYVGVNGQLSVYGLIADNPAAPAPVINPPSGSFTGSQTVTISEAIAGATVYYTTDGSTPTTTSAVYSKPLLVTTDETITAIASANGYEQSAPASATFSSTTTPTDPVFSLASGTYLGTQTLTITESKPGTTIYYTIDGPAPTTSSAVYTQPLAISASAIVRAIAIAPGPFSSAVVSATYTIQPNGTIDFSQGFALANGPMSFNGSTDLDDFRLQLTNGGSSEAGTAFYATPVNIQQFTTNFTFQLSNPAADGITFTIQNVGPKAVGGAGAGLGYGGMTKSVAIKFDLYSNAGEGPDSTGLYTNGAAPTVPAIDLSATGINLHGGDYMNATLTYDGSNLTLTLTDNITLATWSHVWVINIPATVGGNTAYVGFTGGTGGLSSSQKFTSWTYIPGPPVPGYTAGFAPGTMTFNGGAALNGNTLEVTDGGTHEARSAFFSIPVNVQQFVASFDLQLTKAVADGMTFTIQGSGLTAVGGDASQLGFGGIKKSVAIKFDLYNNGGEGQDSTGLYVNGATPTVPSVDLSASGIELHNGDPLHVQLAYNGSILTVTISDTVTGATATQTYSVDIPSVVGGTTAYVGFTGGTGGSSAIQQVLNWSFSPQPLTGPALTTGFTAAQTLFTLNGGATVNGSALQLTDGNASEKRSAFYTTPLNVQQFSTSFDFQLINAMGDGFTFTIQGTGPTALGYGGGLGLGYQGITKSVAVKFDLYNNSGEGSDSTGLYTNGAVPTLPATDLTATGINLHSGDLFNAQLSYNGATLIVVITDTVTGAKASQTYNVNIPGLVGGPTAYVGFTAATGGLASVQQIINWTYSSAPASEPAFTAGFSASQSQLTMSGGAALNGSAVELTDGNNSETRSAFFTTPVNVQQFSTNFNFQLTNANGDGFTFMIQGISPVLIGAGGMGLGSANIPNGVAVKFDLYNNAGEGSDSTGLYTNGAMPTLPATDLTSTGINLHSGDIFNAQLTYNGATLAVVITDTVTKATATQNYTVNIPSIVGAPTAYVGFTAATGGMSAVQQILNWTYSN